MKYIKGLYFTQATEILVACFTKITDVVPKSFPNKHKLMVPFPSDACTKADFCVFS